MEPETPRERRRRLVSHLDMPSYAQLFGLDDHLARLADLVSADAPPWVTAIEGIGGIGKTALADAFMRSQLDNLAWADFGWLTARRLVFNPGGALRTAPAPALSPEGLVLGLFDQLLDPQAPLSFDQKHAALRRRLKEAPHLVVVDNLETAEDLAVLLALVGDLAGPSRFLLTTRVDLAAPFPVHRFPVPPLGQADALRLLRAEAGLRRCQAVLELPDAGLLPVYCRVGGNPLALRLVVGQLLVDPLDAVLAGLTDAASAHVEDLYTFIYRRAWQHLDEISRRVFLATPLSVEGGSPSAFFVEVTGLPAAELRHGLDRLVAFNLVDARTAPRDAAAGPSAGTGEGDERLYSIHSLTRAFLHRHVLRWL